MFIVYPGGDLPSNLEEAKRHFAKYQEWLASLGDSAVSPANPFKNTNTVNPDGIVTIGSSTAMSGYTIIEADSMERVLENAQACPFLDIVDQYTIQGDLFSLAILEDLPVPTPIEDAVANMRVIEAIFRSDESGEWETIVHQPEIIRKNSKIAVRQAGLMTSLPLKKMLSASRMLTRTSTND